MAILHTYQFTVLSQLVFLEIIVLLEGSAYK